MAVHKVVTNQDVDGVTIIINAANKLEAKLPETTETSLELVNPLTLKVDPKQSGYVSNSGELEIKNVKGTPYYVITDLTAQPVPIKESREVPNDPVVFENGAAGFVTGYFAISFYLSNPHASTINKVEFNLENWVGVKNEWQGWQVLGSNSTTIYGIDIDLHDLIDDSLYPPIDDIGLPDYDAWGNANSYTDISIRVTYEHETDGVQEALFYLSSTAMRTWTLNEPVSLNVKGTHQEFVDVEQPRKNLLNSKG